MPFNPCDICNCIPGNVGNEVFKQAVLALLCQIQSSQSTAPFSTAVAGGNFFSAVNTGVQALSVNSTTATGLILTNPVGSDKILSLVDVSVAIASLPAGQTTLILTGSPSTGLGAVTHTTPLTIVNASIGDAGTPVAKADSAATLPAGGNTIIRSLGAGTAATVAASTAFPPFIRVELNGLLQLHPGAFISLQALTTAVSVVASMVWEEIAL